MLSTLMKANMHIIKKNLIRINHFSHFKFSTKEEKIKEEQRLNEIHSYVKAFRGNKLEKINDSFIINNKLLGKLSSLTNTYLVFQSNLGYRVIKVLLLQILMIIPCLILFYYSLKGTFRQWQFNQIGKLNSKFISTNFALYGYSSFCLLSIFLLNLLRKNNLNKIWKYVKKIELSKDLKKLQITTFFNKTINTEFDNVYLYYNFSSPYVSPSNLSKVEDTLVIGVKKQILIIPLERSTIQSKDLLSLCLRGYSLTLNKET